MICAAISNGGDAPMNAYELDDTIWASDHPILNQINGLVIRLRSNYFLAEKGNKKNLIIFRQTLKKHLLSGKHCQWTGFVNKQTNGIRTLIDGNIRIIRLYCDQFRIAGLLQYDSRN